jgi:transcriptional regulator with XRE-family HTH domain
MMKNNIKAIRKIRNISQQVIADSLGVTITAVNKWENNFNIKIPDKRIKEIAELLGVGEQDILVEDLDIEKIRLRAAQEQLEQLRNSGNVVFSFVEGEDMSEDDYEAINDRFAWKRSMYPVIESFVSDNFAKYLSPDEQMTLGKNIALFMQNDADQITFLQRVVRYFVDKNDDEELAALYQKHRQENLIE